MAVERPWRRRIGVFGHQIDTIEHVHRDFESEKAQGGRSDPSSVLALINQWRQAYISQARLGRGDQVSSGDMVCFWRTIHADYLTEGALKDLDNDYEDLINDATKPGLWTQWASSSFFFTRRGFSGAVSNTVPLLLGDQIWALTGCSQCMCLRKLDIR